MKKFSAIYLVIFSLLVIGASCSKSDETVLVTSPYAYIYSFGIGNIESPFHDLTVDGKDTIVQKLISGEEYEFVIDQKAKEVYNVDSLIFGTKTDKVCGLLSCKGTPYRYDAESGEYVFFSSSDSVDFTNPLLVKVVSTDATYTNYYTIKLNVHAVDPDLLRWEAFEPSNISSLTPVRLLENDGTLYLFGLSDAGAPVVARSSAAAASSWEVIPITVADADIASVMLFDGKLCMVAGGDLYVSSDAVEWALSSQGAGVDVLLSVSNGGRELWAAGGSNILRSTDAVTFETVQPLSDGFPLYGCSYACTPLATNKNIYRTTLIGYTTAEKDGDVAVWSKLSTDDAWSAFGVESDYECPSLAGLQVVNYDDALYAFGGAGIVDKKEVKPFSLFYVSKDKGIAWKPTVKYNLQFPEELQGKETPFATAVSGDNHLWIVTPGGVWKGIINRLTFNR